MHHFNLINIGIVLHLSKTDPPIFKNSITIDHVMNFFPFFHEKSKQRKEEKTNLVPEKFLRRKLRREETSEPARRKPRACQTMGRHLQIQI